MREKGVTMGGTESPTRDIAHDRTVLSDVPAITMEDPERVPHPPVQPTLPSAGAREAHADETTIRVDVRPAGTAPVGDTSGAPHTLPSADAPRKPAARVIDAGQVLAGKYELTRLLGQGGMGKVWKGVHVGLGIPIAVKVMHPEIAGASDYARRFQREAHAASLLNHPNVVRVLDFGEDAGTLYMVMEYLEGRSLASWLRDLAAPPPLGEVASVLHMLLDAFQVAHSFGIVHRDLKPDNVFLINTGLDGYPRTPGGGNTVKVVDFGLAHVDDARDRGPTLTSRDVVAGTPEYMSPEQCRSLAVGPSADLYSIGCVLTEMLQQAPPFTGGSAIEVLAKQMFSPPPPLSRPPGAEPVPPLLERLRIDLLSKVPEKRPRDAAEVKARLYEAMSPEATEARLPTRKGDEPLGDRAARAPRWDAARPADTAPDTTRTRPRSIGLVRLAEAHGGVSDEHRTGLSAHKLETIVLQGVADPNGEELRVLVVDAGPRIDEAAALLAELRRTRPRCHALVCAEGLSTDRMNTLVAAGAADVLRYPVTADALARKVERMLRRGR